MPLSDSPIVPACVVGRAYEYGVGRPATAGEREWLLARIAEAARGRPERPESALGHQRHRRAVVAALGGDLQRRVEDGGA